MNKQTKLSRSRWLLLCLLSLLMTLGGTGSAWAGAVSDYTVNFKTISNGSTNKPIGWATTTSGTNAGTTDWSWNSSYGYYISSWASTNSVALVTPSVSGQITIKTAVYSGSGYTFKVYKYTEEAGVYTQGDEIAISDEITTSETTISFSVDAATHLGIIAKNIELHSFTAASAVVPDVKAMSITAFSRTSAYSVTAGVGNVFDATFSVTVQNTGNVDLTAEEVSVSIKNSDGSITYGSAVAAEALTAGSSVALTVNATNINAGAGGTMYFYAWENLTDTKYASSTYVSVTAYIAQFAFKYGSSTISEGSLQNYGFITSNSSGIYTIQNAGTAPLHVTSITAPTGWTITPNADFDVTAGSSTNVTVQLNVAPGSYGRKNGDLTITHDLGTFTVPVDGVAVDPSKQYVDFSGNDWPVGWSAGTNWSASSGYASQSNYSASSDLITDKIQFAAGEKLYIEAKSKGASWDALKIYSKAVGESEWTELVDLGSTLTTTKATYEAAIETAGTYYIKFEGQYVEIYKVYGGAELPKPQNVSISKQGTTVTMTWTASTNNETNWQVYISDDEDAIDGDITPTNVSTTSSHQFTELAVNTPYYAWVRSKFAESSFSDWVKTTFTLGYTAASPTGVDGEGISNVTFGTGTEIVNYNTPKTPYYQDNSAQIGGIAAGTTANIDITYATGYTYGTVIWVDWNQNYEFEESEVVYTGTSTNDKPTTLNASFDIAADQPVGNYRMRIAGADSYFDTYIGGGAYNAAFPDVSNNYAVAHDYTLKVNEAPSVLAPSALTKNSVGAFTATLGWTENGDATAWQIALGTTSEFDPDGVTPIDANANPFTVTGLDAETTYYAYVRAKKGDDTSDWSNKVEFTTTTSKPTDVVVAPSDNSAKFSWTANAGETAWQLVYSTDADFDKSLASPVAITTNPYTLTGLVPETTYYAYLRADLGGDEYSDWTDKLTFTPGYNHELTVHDKTNTNAYVPVYGQYCDDYLKSEFVIPASELAVINGQTIESMKFYLSSKASASWGDASFQVFLKEVGSSTIDAFSGTEGATIVYEGALDGTQDVMTIDFTNTYNYNGGNLLVGIYNTVKGTWKAAEFYGENVTGSSVSGYSSSSLAAVTATARNFIPKTTFTWQTVTGPRLAVSTDALDYGELNQESTAGDKQKTFTISNTGVAELTGLSVAVSGTGYSVSALPRTNITTTGETADPIELTVTLAPTTSGTYNGTVTVSATGQPNKVINLTATYVADPIMGVFNDELATEAATTGQTVNFGYVEAAPTYTYYIKNTGAGTLDVAVTDGGFTVAPANASLAAGEQQAFTITPNVANADATVTFTGTNHDGGAAIGTFSVTLQGTVMPLTTTFFEGFDYDNGNATTTELVGWEVNNSTNNITFNNGNLLYSASSTEAANVITPKLRVAGTSDVLRINAYARNLSWSNTKLAISYSADKTNWTELTNKGKDDFTTANVLQAFEFSGIPEGSYYFNVELSDVAVGYVYGFSTTLPAAVAIDEGSDNTGLSAEVRDVEVTYTKAAEKWGTIALPFATTTTELGNIYSTTVNAYEMKSYDEGTGELVFQNVSTLEAGKPYIIYSPDAMSGTVTFYNKDITATTADSETLGTTNTVTFHATYAPIAAPNMNGKWGVTPAGKVMMGGASATMKGLRGYLTTSAGAHLGIVIDDETTGIRTLLNADDLNNGLENTYNLNGQKVNSAHKGIYIVNGKKVVVK